jgi:two-component system nitrate/nitrite response regulator NarL
MTLRALIVDDNAEFLDAASRLLKGEGIAIVGVAPTAAEAFRLVEKHDPDVVLVDVYLGDDSGLDLAERLRQSAGRRRPVILISADSEVDVEDLIAASSAVGFVSKSRLSANAIAELLDRGERADGFEPG